MEQWQCHKVCFFRSKLYQPGEFASGKEHEIPRHFRSVSDGRQGKFGQEKKEALKNEQKINLEDIMKDSPLLEKAKHLTQMNKIELCALGKSLGQVFDLENTTRAEMIKICTELREKKSSTNQEMADLTKR